MQERILEPDLQPDLLTFEEFFEFVQTRPDEERWELFDGVKVMQASANNLHQMIASNMDGICSFHAHQPSFWVTRLGY